MGLLLAGFSHHTAPVELRERLARCDLADAPSGPAPVPGGIKESLFLSTCNRVEHLVVAEDGLDEDAFRSAAVAWLAAASGLEPEAVGSGIYVKSGREAVRHVFRVAASLDSLMVGEPQILGQIKTAYRQAAERRTLGAILNRLMHKTFSVAKRVRTETGVSDRAVSIAFAAVELAKQIFGHLRDKRALLVGAGEMAELAAEHFLAQGAASLTVANRTLERAVELAQRFGGQAASLEELPAALVAADMVVASTAAPRPIITAEMLRAALRPRKRRPLFIIDIAVPRDVEEAAGEVENVYLYNVDDLRAVVERNIAARRDEAAKAERIVAEEAIKFEQWLESLSAQAIIRDLAAKFEDIRRREMDKTLAGIDLPPDQAERIARDMEAMTRAMMKKVIHGPATFLKREFKNPDNRDRYLDAVQRLFELDGRQTEQEGED